MIHRTSLLLALAGAALACAACAQQPTGRPGSGKGYNDTPMLPGGKWRVHDSKRPSPVVVTPGVASTQEKAGTAPSDATVLFDGKDLSAWQHRDGKDPLWVVENGEFHRPAAPKPSGGDIVTKGEFGDVQLHLEFCSAVPPTGDDQGRGNSGVFFFDGRYEVQVLDSFNNPTYADGSAASLYAQYPPLVNASRKPGEWQTYDIIFIAPRFKDGKVETPGTVTMLHNGVLVHNKTALMGRNLHRTFPTYEAHGLKGRLGLQDHGSIVRFRNVWVRDVKDYDD